MHRSFQGQGSGRDQRPVVEGGIVEVEVTEHIERAGSGNQQLAVLSELIGAIRRERSLFLQDELPGIGDAPDIGGQAGQRDGVVLAVRRQGSGDFVLAAQRDGGCLALTVDGDLLEAVGTGTRQVAFRNRQEVDRRTCTSEDERRGAFFVEGTELEYSVPGGGGVIGRIDCHLQVLAGYVFVLVGCRDDGSMIFCQN